MHIEKATIVEFMFGITGILIFANWTNWWIAAGVACIAIFVKGIKM